MPCDERACAKLIAAYRLAVRDSGSWSKNESCLMYWVLCVRSDLPENEMPDWVCLILHKFLYCVFF